MDYNNEYLMHYGIKGQKWGVRRYQNKDGSLTPKGKKRYNSDVVKTKVDEISSKRKERKRIRKEASKQSYVRSVGRTVGRDIGIMTATGAAMGYSVAKGKSHATNTIATIGSAALNASNLYGAIDLGKTFARRNGLI